MELLPANKRAYLFLDEIQRIDQWQDAVNSFRIDFDCDSPNLQDGIKLVTLSDFLLDTYE